MPQQEHFAVLTVDDDPAIRRTLRAVLEDEGHETGEAGNATEAYAALEQRRWDAVLLDLTMPGEHGLIKQVAVADSRRDRSSRERRRRCRPTNIPMDAICISTRAANPMAGSILSPGII